MIRTRLKEILSRMRKTMLYVTLLFWSTEYECDVGYNFAKKLIRDNKAILENVHSTQYKKTPVR